MLSLMWVERAISNGRGGGWSLMSDMVEGGLVLELRRHHLRLNRSLVNRHARSIIVVVVIILSSLAIEVGRAFVFVGTTILFLLVTDLLAHKKRDIRIDIWSEFLQCLCSSTRTISCCSQIL
jgi:hypothetical protein